MDTNIKVGFIVRHKNYIFSLYLGIVCFSQVAHAFQLDSNFYQGHFEASLQHWQTILEKTTDRTKQIEAKIGLAFAYQKLGFHDRTRSFLNEATLQLSESPNEINEIWIYIGLSDYLSATHKQPDKNQQYLAQAKTLATRLKELYLLAEVLKREGNRLNSLGKIEEAQATYQESLALAQQIGHRPLTVELLINLTNLNKKYNDFKHAIQEIQQLEPSYVKTFGWITLSKLADNIDVSPQDKLYYIKESLKQAINNADKTEDWRNLSYAHGLLGEYYTNEEKDDENALKELHRALFFAQQSYSITTPLTVEKEEVSPLPELTYRWYWKLGHILRKQPEIEPALNNYRRAVEQLKFVRFSLSNRYFSDFDEEIAPVYLELADLLVEKALTIESFQAQQESLQEAKKVLEQLAEQELRNYLQIDNCESLKGSTEESQTCKPTAESKIAKGTAVLYSILRSKETLKFLLLFDDVFYPVQISNEILKKIGQFHDKCSKDNDECQSLGKTLYLYFIEPFEAILQDHDVKKLIIVPNGDLKKIPFSALYNEKAGKYLIEEYQLTFAQGVNTINYSPCGKKELQIFLGGISKQVPGFESVPLPKTKDELENIQLIFSGNTLPILLDEKFDKNSIKNTIQELINEKPFLLHFSTHAQFGESLEETFFLVYDGKFSLTDFEEIFQEKHPELITLSACETATGNSRIFLGLAGMAVKLGAKSALGSLWEVDDKATSELMPTFYEIFKNETVSKSEALQRAQVQLLRDSNYQHPYYWASFILIGNL